MKKSLFIIIAFFIAAGLAACEQDGLSSGDPSPRLQQSGNVTIYTSRSMYQDLREKRAGGVSENFEIKDVKRTREGDRTYLEIEIIHQTCGPSPRVVWDGAVAESYPPQVYLFIQLLAGDECPDGKVPEEKTDIVSLDLVDLLQDEWTAENATFHVLNASKKQDTNDHSDEPVSSEDM